MSLNFTKAELKKLTKRGRKEIERFESYLQDEHELTPEAHFRKNWRYMGFTKQERDQHLKHLAKMEELRLKTKFRIRNLEDDGQ